MRLIDADRLLDRCIFYHLPNGRVAVPVIDVQHAPTVEPSPGWIPVTERMPEEGHNILISTAYGYVGEGEYKGYKEYHHTWVQYRWSVILRDDEVTAWMPLPEPYREEEQDD